MKFWNWLGSHHQELSVVVASLALTIAAATFVFATIDDASDDDFRMKRETLAFFIDYSPATRHRGRIAQDPRLAKFFDHELAIPADVIADLVNDHDGSNDSKLRADLIDLVNYNEMMCLGRQNAVLDAELFDLQFKEILQADYRVLRNFLALTVQKKDASYPFWKEALAVWGINADELVK